MVFQPPTPGQKHGHIQMWDGEKWGSDFRQPTDNFWPGPSYRSMQPAYQFFRYIMILIFVIVGVVNAQNTNVDEATKLLNTLYKSTVLSDKFLDYGNKSLTSKYFSSDMVDLLYLERKCHEETGEICRLDWDFLCDCQDKSDKFSVTFETISVKPVQILVKIADIGNKSELLFNFIVENGKMKISDIIDGDNSLKKLLQSPL